MESKYVLPMTTVVRPLQGIKNVKIIYKPRDQTLVTVQNL